MLRFIDQLQDESIGILTGHGIVAGRIRVLCWGIKNRYPQGNELGIELVHVCPAVHMECQMVEPWGIAVILPPFARPPGTFERDGEHALPRIGDGPTRDRRGGYVHGDPTVAQQGQDGIIKGDRAVGVGNGEIEMAQGSTDHEVFRLIMAAVSSYW
jgi:hypothetical protein